MLSCSDYDYIEIVCMYSFPIRLTLTSGEVIEGTALDTQRNDLRQECIKLDSVGVELLVELDSISVLQVCVENPHFSKVSFEHSDD